MQKFVGEKRGTKMMIAPGIDWISIWRLHPLEIMCIDRHLWVGHDIKELYNCWSREPTCLGTPLTSRLQGRGKTGSPIASTGCGVSSARLSQILVSKNVNGPFLTIKCIVHMD